VEEIAISKFKATCLAVLEEVRKTRRPVRVTRFGKPVAEIVPPSVQPAQSWLGCMRHHGEITGDLVAPVSSIEEWTVDEDEIALGYPRLDLGGATTGQARRQRSSPAPKRKK
jgi:prevent-host-death family protein